MEEGAGDLGAGVVNTGTVHKREESYNLLQAALRGQDEDAGPIVPAAYDIHPSLVLETEDGRTFHELSFAFKRVHVERFRQGYACIQCWEKFPDAFPETCRACGFKVREQQAEVFAKTFEGMMWIGSRIDLEEEQERLSDWDARDRHDPNSHIYIPEWVKL